MFYSSPNHIYRVTELDALPWLIHGFGTRDSDIRSAFSKLATVRQIHSSLCVAADGRTGVLGEADALVENTPGNVVAVKTADCLPVLLVDERIRAAAAVHAGWRGTAAGIVRDAVAMMREKFGTRAEDLHAAIGPGIGVCCYEVGPEVAGRFGVRRVEGQGRAHLDLPAENRRQLLESGVTGERIYASNLCTMCRSGEFHSFRRDGEAAGRMYSFVGIR